MFSFTNIIRMSFGFPMIFIKSFYTEFFTNFTIHSIFTIFTINNLLIVTIHLFRSDCLKLIIFNKLDDFVNVIKKDFTVRNKINDMLDRYNRLPYKYHSEVGYDALIQKFILKELKNIMGTTIVDIDIELKMKISRIENLESKTNTQIFKSVP